MKSKLMVFLSLLAALSCLLAAAAPLALADDAAPDVASPDAATDDLVIAWTPPGFTVPLAPGETEIVRAVFTSRRAIERAMLVVSFPLSRYVRVEPHAFSIVPGVSYRVELTISLPDDTAAVVPPMIMGMVQVMGNGRVYSQPLPVTIIRTNVRPPIQWTPPQVKLAVDIPEITAGQIPPTTAEVSFTTHITIENALLRATPPLGQYLDLSVVGFSDPGPITIVPGITYTVVLTAHQPLATTPGRDAENSTESVDPTNARRVVSGLVEIFDAWRVYPRSLAVEVLVGPVQAPPVVSWRPAFVSFILGPNEPASRVVTVTSNVTIEDVVFSVSGPITRYVSILDSATPVTLLPRTPHQVTLVVTSPPAPVFSRTLAGEVVVVDSSGRPLRQELKVMLTWLRPRPTPEPVP